ncbi:MAG: hypothetical protein J6W15_05415 [Clostridia bacterium]|nr:hypothetical protein [Clostridia bacterium]MBO7217063.1 hypothetical protein [Clostridia bacterium]MBO7246303.1 hypothetical protein [Clostridia bacterium]MBO7737272.1 hypothetical protein [Clostridia bacterium]
MRTVNIKAFKDRLESEEWAAVCSGSGEEICLVFLLEEDLQKDYTYYLRFHTSWQAKRGGMSVTAALECKNGIILYRLPETLADTQHLGIQLLAVKGDKRVYSPVLKNGLRFLNYCPCRDSCRGKGLLNFYDINDYAARKRELPFCV